MNVVTGVFVSSAMAAAEDEKHDILLQQLSDLFFDLDMDGSGGVTAEEFQAHAQHPTMVTFLKRLDLCPADVNLVFSILDKDGSGEIDAEELVTGCLRLVVPTKSFDLSLFTRNLSLYFEKLDGRLQNLNDQLADGGHRF